MTPLHFSTGVYINRTSYPPGTKVSDEEMLQLRLEPTAFHGEWNYTIRPRTGS
jgi:hypothetical protein